MISRLAAHCLALERQPDWLNRVLFYLNCSNPSVATGQQQENNLKWKRNQTRPSPRMTRIP